MQDMSEYVSIYFTYKISLSKFILASYNAGETSFFRIGTFAIVDIIMVYRGGRERGGGGGGSVVLLALRHFFFLSFPLCLHKIGGPGPL